jgi:hypothetical protein
MENQVMTDEFERTLRIRADNEFNSAREHRYELKGFVFWNLAMEYERILQDYRDYKKK